MQATATKVVRVYADVTIKGVGRDFRVYPNGAVYVFVEDANDWFPYDSYEDYFDEVRAAGLAVME